MVRPATPADAGAIAAIHVRAWQAAYAHILSASFLQSLSITERTRVWDTRLREGVMSTYVAEQASQVIGWAIVGPSRDAEAPPTTGELWALYVAPEHWGDGAGRALWARGRAHLHALGCQEAIVWVLADNRRGRRFYEAAGFVRDPNGERTIELGGRHVAEIRLRCRLAAAARPSVDAGPIDYGSNRDQC